MSNRISAHRAEAKFEFGRPWVLVVFGLVSLTWPIAAGRATAQDQGHLAFEVASVKPNRDPNQREQRGFLPGGTVTATNTSLRSLILMAYHIEPYRLSGGPNWLDTETYNVLAKADANAIAPGPVDRERIHRMELMLQALLAERFQLAVHHETRAGDVYALVIAKGGPRLQEAKGVDCRVTAGCGDFSRISPNGYLEGPKVSVLDLAEALSRFVVGRPVYDKTGLTGVFDIKLQWTRDGYKPRDDGAPTNEPQPDATGPSIFSALQEQLGLRLEANKGPIEILVIDRAEKPSAD